MDAEAGIMDDETGIMDAEAGIIDAESLLWFIFVSKIKCVKYFAFIFDNFSAILK